MSDPEPVTRLSNPFPTFPFTGSLRPVYPLSPRRTVPDSIPHPDYAKDGIPIAGRKFLGRHNITILDKKQQDAMRKVCRMAREVLDIAARAIRPGVTTDYIDEIVHQECIKREVRLRELSYLQITYNFDSLTRRPLTTTISPNPSARHSMR